MKLSYDQYLSEVDKYIHDIRTPLTSILGYSQIIENRLADASKEKEQIEIIIEETHKITRILKEFGELTKKLKSGL